MAIERTVETDVYCDVCGEWIMGWKSNDTGVSRAWAAEYTRRRGGTVGKKIVCKKCRIKERIRTCSLQRKIGNAGRDSDGTCMGFASVTETIAKQPLMVTVAYDTGKKDAEGYPIMAEHEVVNSQVERLAIIQDRYFKQCRQGAADFGLTVSSRCRLIIPKAPEAPKTNKFKDKFA